MLNEQTIEKELLEDNALSKDFDTRSLLQFAFPTIFMMIFCGLYTIIDTIFIARFVNTDALSAINIVTPVVNLIVGLATMLATGGSAIIARKMGDGNYNEARKNFTLITTTCAIIGIIFTVIGLTFIDPLLYTLGASHTNITYCSDYLSVLLIFAPANMLQVLFACLFVTAGKPGLGMIIGIAAGLANTLFDYLFIVVLPIGIKGAAFATGIGYSVPMITGIIFFFCNTRGTLFFNVPEFNFCVLSESAYNGSSEMVGQLSTAVTTFLFNTAMLALAGVNGVAAITIIIYSQFLLTTLFIGFSMGIAPVISYNYGCQNHQRLNKIIKSSLSLILVISIAITAFTLFFGNRLVEIFTPAGSPVYSIASKGFLIFPFAFLFIGFNLFISAMFTALSNGKYSAILSFTRSFLIASGIIVFPWFLGINGLWVAIPLAELLSLCLAIWMIYNKKHTQRVQ